MKRGPRVKSAGAVRRVPLNMRVPPALRKSIEKAADLSGRSLCAEVEYRCQEYEMLRRFFDWKTQTIAPDCALSIEVTDDDGRIWTWAS